MLKASFSDDVKITIFKEDDANVSNKPSKRVCR